MMNMNRTALVLGATGGIGGAVAEALARHGWAVRSLAREPAGAASAWSRPGKAPQWIAGDAMNRDDMIRAADGCDAIVHAVNPPGYRDWERLVLPMIENSIAAARAAGGARIVLPGTIYNFDPAGSLAIDADTPQEPRTRKGAVRKALEIALEVAAPEVPSLIVRAGDFFGPGARASWFAQALVKPGQPVRRLVNPAKGVGHSWAYLPDLAETIVRLMDVPDALRRFERVQFEGFWDADGSAMPDTIRHVVGRDLPERSFPWWLMHLLAAFGGFPREAAEIAQYWRHPVRLDNRRLLALIGAEPRTPNVEAVRATLTALGCLEKPAVQLCDKQG
jgi:nucleoside-diphosphate-sugar epimerase